MTPRNTHLVHSVTVARRRRPRRHLEVFAPPAAASAAAATGDAEQLIADLLALVDVGAINLRRDRAGTTRYGPCRDDVDLKSTPPAATYQAAAHAKEPADALLRY